MPISFFSPTTKLTGLPEALILQSSAPSDSYNRQQGLNTDGDEIASQIYGHNQSVTEVYKSFEDTGSIPLSLVTPGTVKGTWHIDSVSVKYTPTDYVELSVTAHQHIDCEPGVTSHNSNHRKVQDPIASLPYGFGIPVGLRTLVGLTDSTVGIASFTYDLSITHQDEVGGAGNYLASENRDGAETITVEFTGDPGTIGIEGWDLTAKSENNSNTTAETVSYTFTRHLSTVAAS